MKGFSVPEGTTPAAYAWALRQTLVALGLTTPPDTRGVRKQVGRRLPPPPRLLPAHQTPRVLPPHREQ